MHPGQALYCFLFDSSCLQWGTRSVYELVTTARDLRIRITVSPRDPGAPGRRAMLELFDRAVVDEGQLDSDAYFCARWNIDVMTWTFDYDGRAWRSAHSIFDQYTDVHCPPEERSRPRGLEDPASQPAGQQPEGCHDTGHAKRALQLITGGYREPVARTADGGAGGATSASTLYTMRRRAPYTEATQIMHDEKLRPAVIIYGVGRRVSFTPPAGLSTDRGRDGGREVTAVGSLPCP